MSVFFDIQRFDDDAGTEVKKVALEVLNVFGQIVTNLGLTKLAEELDKAQDASEWLTKNVNPVLKFIGTTKFGKKFADYSKLITNSISIIDNTLAIAKGGLSDATRNSKIVSIAGSLESMASATNKLNRDTLLSKDNDNLWFLSIVSGGISLVASIITGMDGITESEQEKINRNYISFMKTLGSDLIEKIFDNAIEKNLSRAFNENVTDDLLADIFKKGKFFQEAAPVFLKTFKGIMTFGSGILNGYNKYKNNLEKYLDDGIPEDIAKHDAFIDSIAKFAKETMSGIVFGVDDLIFDVAKWITSGLGIEYAEDENKDYIETLIYKTPLKKLNYTNTGLSTDDKILYVLEDSSMVYGDNGNDAIDNFGFSNATIWGGHDNDTIHSYKTESATPQNNSIFGGPGNDQIVVYDKLSTVYGGKDNDSIIVTGTNNIIYGNAGNDSIYVYIDADENAISGGTGDDKIILLEGTKDALIKYTEGDGNDIIYYFDENDALKISGSYKISINDTDVKIIVGNGSILLVGASGKNIKINGKIITSSDVDDDTLPVEKIILPNVSTMTSIFKSPFVYGTDGNDTIDNYKDNVLINAGLGNDTVYNEGYQVTINGGEGNDSIRNENGGKNVNIIGNSGDDYIYNYWSNSNVMIDGGINNDYISNHGANVTIDAGEGTDTIYNESYQVTINGGEGNDSIDNFGSNVSINGSAGNDSIYNYKYGFHVTINGGTGSDYIYNQENLIVTGNTVENSGRFVTINGGEGNDSIDNFGSNVSINGGAGNDSIYNHGPDTNIASLYRTKSPSYVTINSGAGDDVIISQSYGDGILIEYSNGDGHDTISGLGSNGTLKITGAQYSTLKSGNDIKIIVGNGSILLENKASIDFTIDGTLGGEIPSVNNSSNNIEIKGTEGDDTIANFGSNVTIIGGLRNDSIYNKGSNVTIDAGEGNDEIKNTGDSVTVNAGIGNDSIENVEGSLVTIDGGAGNDFIKNYSNSVTINGGTDDDEIYNYGNNVLIDGSTDDDEIYNYGDNVLIDGGSSNDWIENDCSNVTISCGEGDDTVYNRVYVKNTSISGGAGNDSIINFGSNVTISGGTGNDSINLYFDHSETNTNTKTVTLTDFSEEDIITLSDSVKAINFDETTKTLKIDDKWIVYLPNSTSLATWNVEGNVVSYILEQNLQFVLAKGGKSITCIEATTTSVTSALTITGLKSDLTVVDGKIDGITLDGKKITVSESVLDGKDVTITEGYELALSDAVKAPEKSAATWSVENGTATYKDRDTTAGYVVEDGKIVYTPASVGETLIKIEGLSATATTDGISLTDKTVTLSESVLDEKEVTISEGYTLAIADDVTKPETGEPSWGIDDNVATYKAGNTTAGYILADNKISYAEAQVGENLIAISGVKSLDGLTLNGKVVTVSESSLNGVDVTINGEGYSLALATDVISPVINNPSWIVTNGTATCQGNRTAGYTLENNKIVYHEAVTDETLITVTGLKDDAQVSGIFLSGTKVTLSDSVLDEKEVTINEGYTLALADDVTKTTTGAGSWSIDKEVATYKAGDVTAGYSVTDNKISYSAAKVGEKLVTVSGVKSVDGLTLKDKVVTVAENSLDEKEVTISKNYTLELASGVSKPTATTPAWTVTNGTATYRLSGMTAGYTLDNGKIVYKTAVEGETSITVSGLKNTATATNISLNNDTLNITNAAISTGTITVTAPDSVKKVTVGGAGKFTFDGQTFSVDTAAEFTLDSNKVIGYKVTGNSAAHLNNSYSNLTITGGNGADVISVGGSGSQNTIIGNGGNDTLYSNGSSNVFQYTGGAGNDVIYNLGNKDTVQVASGNVDSIYAEKGGDVIVKVGSANIRLKNKSGQTINVKNVAGNITSQSYTYTEPTKPATSTPTTPSTPSNPSTPSTPNKSSTTTTPSTTPSSSGSSSSRSSSNSSSSNNSSSSSTTRPSSTSSSSNSRSSSSSNSNNNSWGSSSSSNRSSSSNNSSSSGNSSNSNGSTTKQNTTTTSNTPTPIEKTSTARADGTTAIMYNYTGGHRTVANYSPSEKINLSGDVTGISISGNSLVINSSTGELTIEKVRDKIIDVSLGDCNTAAYAYMASGECAVPGNLIENVYEVIVASESSPNTLIAGNAGSSLIGGGGVATFTSGAGDDFMKGGTAPDTFVYNGGNDVINSYQSGEILNFAATYAGWTTDGNDLVINAAEGSVRIQEASNKLVEFAIDNNVIAHVFKAEDYEGALDGRSFGGFEVIVGSDNQSNQIYANDVGSSLWGGRGNANDDLYGGAGSDELIYSYGNGRDNIFNVGPEDSVNLLNVSLDQIANAQITDNGVTAQFTDGGALNINGQAGNFKLGGQTFHADYQNKIWS